MTTNTTTRQPNLTERVTSLEAAAIGQHKLIRMLAELLMADRGESVTIVTETDTVVEPETPVAPAAKAVAKKVAKKAPAKKTAAKKAVAKKTTAKKATPAKALTPRTVTPAPEAEESDRSILDQLDPTVLASLRADGLKDDDIIFGYRLQSDN
jgi:hypothetical protein